VDLKKAKLRIAEVAYRRLARQVGKQTEDLPQEIILLLDELKCANWDDEIEEIHQEHMQAKERREALNNEISLCGRCKTPHPKKDLKTLWNIPGFHFEYCPQCADLAIKEYSRICCLCNKSYLAKKATETYELCPDCVSPQKIQEYRRLAIHLRRASSVNQPATLTLQQWLDTLDYFNWKCAYCLQSYKGIEHYLPIALGGGTTQKNCLPSCSTCNTRKKDKHPDDFKALFPSANIARIAAYFASVA